MLNIHGPNWSVRCFYFLCFSLTGQGIWKGCRSSIEATLQAAGWKCMLRDIRTFYYCYLALKLMTATFQTEHGGVRLWTDQNFKQCSFSAWVQQKFKALFFLWINSWSEKYVVIFLQGLTLKLMDSALRQVALWSVCWMYPIKESTAIFFRFK